MANETDAQAKSVSQAKIDSVIGVEVTITSRPDRWGMNPSKELLTGVIVQYQPFGGSMCDVLIQFSDGYECWYSSTERGLRDVVPDRRWIQELRRLESITQLEAILENFIKVEFYKPWPGCEFGKTLIGNGIVGALEELKGRQS